MAIVKCKYCRTEFQLDNKGKTSTICKKCERNVKLYGKPSACAYCTIVAAFIGSKCKRCTNSEKEFGQPLKCEQCTLVCAFDHQGDSRKKVDGKLLCWPCTLSYRRALAKAKQNDPLRHTTSGSSSHHRSSSSGLKRKTHHSSGGNPNKKPRMETNSKTGSEGSIPSSSENSVPVLIITDQMVAVTKLREQIASLQKQLSNKDLQLLAKERQITELKAQHSESERELRTKMQTKQKHNDEILSNQQARVRQLSKQLASLSKGKKGSPPVIT